VYTEAEENDLYFVCYSAIDEMDAIETRRVRERAEKFGIPIDINWVPKSGE
jgi:hypothetical protein